jgi:hypothetical protein
MRENHSEDRNRRLQNGSQAGRDIFFSPKEQGIIEREHKKTGKGEKEIIATIFRA